MIEPSSSDNPSLRRQCQLLGISRSSLYYQRRELLAEDLMLMRLIDEEHLRTPVYGTRRITAHLNRLGYRVNRKRTRRLMRRMGLQAVYPRPRTSQPGKGHRIYPYLQRGLTIDQPNPIWATDIGYIPMARGFMYLVAIIGLAQPTSAVLASIEYLGHGLLHRCPGGGPGPPWSS